jgi:hypothetical protein
MKLEVISAFRDKDSQKEYPVGSTYETESKDRVEFLKEKGFLRSETESPLKSLLNKNVDDIIKALPGEYSKEELTELLNLESKGDKRKTVKKHIESLLKGENDGQSGTV